MDNLKDIFKWMSLTIMYTHETCLEKAKAQ